MQVDARTHYYPYHRNEKYPKYMTIDFRKLKVSALRKYVEHHELPLRSDSSPSELAIACARHFESQLVVEESNVLPKFMNAARRIAPPSIAESSALSKRSARRGDTAARDMINTDEALAAAEDDDGAGDRRDRRGDDRRRDDRRSDDRRASESRAAPAMWSYPQEDAYGRNVSASKRMRRDDVAAGGAYNSSRGGRRADEPEMDGGGEVGAEVAGGDDADSTLYCLCNRTSFGEMIGCDNAECPMEWFHLGCVGLTASNRPRGKWYCPECRHYESADDADGDYKRPSLNPPRKRAYGGSGGARRASNNALMQRNKVAVRSSAIPAHPAYAPQVYTAMQRRPVTATAAPYPMSYGAMPVPMRAAVPPMAGQKRR